MNPSGHTLNRQQESDSDRELEAVLNGIARPAWAPSMGLSEGERVTQTAHPRSGSAPSSQEAMASWRVKATRSGQRVSWSRLALDQDHEAVTAASLAIAVIIT